MYVASTDIQGLVDRDKDRIISIWPYVDRYGATPCQTNADAQHDQVFRAKQNRQIATRNHRQAMELFAQTDPADSHLADNLRIRSGNFCAPLSGH